MKNGKDMASTVEKCESMVDSGEDDTGTICASESSRSIPRSVGAASVTGSVRSSNQDRARTAVIADMEVIVLADGLGGLPHGGEAAETVCRFALSRLRRELPRVASLPAHATRAVLLSVVWAAAAKLSVEAALRGYSDQDGLRTTLVLVAEHAEAHVCAWIGDGGVMVIRESGEMLDLLDPHRAEGSTSLLSASLGPVAAGRPSWAMAERHPGDLLIASTDGVADAMGITPGMADETGTVRGEFVASVRAHIAESGGDVRRAVRRVVTELAHAKDAAGGYVIGDNVTVACACTMGA